MNKLVEIRVNEAMDSIHLVKDALDRAMQRRAGAEELSDRVRALENTGININIKGLISYSETMLGRQEANRSLPPRTTVTSAARAWKQFEKEFDGINELAGILGTYRFKPSEKHREKSTVTLQQRADQLDAIRDGRGAQTPQELLQAFEEARPFWGEHLETIAGIVLRDEGYAEELSAVADAIVRLCGGVQALPQVEVKDTLNILGRDQTVLKDLSHTVYFRFPTWSIWGLPLMAHDAWHASDMGGAKFRSRLASVFQSFHMNAEQEKNIWENSLVQDCLADTFATVILGPAYAFACILLLLNVESRRDHVRAELILTALKNILPYPDEKDSVEILLRTIWDDARTTGTNPSPNEGACLLERDCHAVDNLLLAYWETIRERAQRAGNGSITIGAPGRCAQADGIGTCELAKVRCKLADADSACPMGNPQLITQLCMGLIEFMKQRPKAMRYDDDAWLAVNTDLNLFLTRRDPSGNDNRVPAKLRKVDLRYVLYGAWWSRWFADELETDKIHRIAQNAEFLCRELIPKPQQGQPLTADRHGSYSTQS